MIVGADNWIGKLKCRTNVLQTDLVPSAGKRVCAFVNSFTFESSWMERWREVFKSSTNRPFSLVMWVYRGDLNPCRLHQKCVRAWICSTLKENTLLGIVTWSVLGKQNRQVKKLYLRASLSVIIRSIILNVHNVSSRHQLFYQHCRDWPTMILWKVSTFLDFQMSLFL